MANVSGLFRIILETFWADLAAIVVRFRVLLIFGYFEVSWYKVLAIHFWVQKLSPSCKDAFLEAHVLGFVFVCQYLRGASQGSFS